MSAYTAPLPTPPVSSLHVLDYFYNTFRLCKHRHFFYSFRLLHTPTINPSEVRRIVSLTAQAQSDPWATECPRCAQRQHASRHGHINTSFWAKPDGSKIETTLVIYDPSNARLTTAELERELLRELRSYISAWQTKNDAYQEYIASINRPVYLHPSPIYSAPMYGHISPQHSPSTYPMNYSVNYPVNYTNYPPTPQTPTYDHPRSRRGSHVSASPRPHLSPKQRTPKTSSADVHPPRNSRPYAGPAQGGVRISPYEGVYDTMGSIPETEGDTLRDGNFGNYRAPYMEDGEESVMDVDGYTSLF